MGKRTERLKRAGSAAVAGVTTMADLAGNASEVAQGVQKARESFGLSEDQAQLNADRVFAFLRSEWSEVGDELNKLIVELVKNHHMKEDDINEALTRLYNVGINRATAAREAAQQTEAEAKSAEVEANRLRNKKKPEPENADEVERKAEALREKANLKREEADAAEDQIIEVFRHLSEMNPEEVKMRIENILINPERRMRHHFAELLKRTPQSASKTIHSILDKFKPPEYQEQESEESPDETYQLPQGETDE